MVVTKSLPLDSDHFNFDLTEGFEMAVEKDWNVLDFTDLNDELVIYDSDLRALSPSKYGVRIFYKACIPMCYVDPENYPDNPLIKEADNASFRGKYLDLVDGTVIGSPVNKMSQGSTSEQSYGEFGYHGLLIADDVPTTKEAYALPNDRALNHTNVAKWAFAAGSSLASCKVDGDYYQPKDISLYTDNVKGFAYMLMNKGGMNDGGVASFIINNGALAYSIDTSGNRFNLPTDNDYAINHKYLQPALFVPFGVAFRDHLTLNDQETPVDTAGWFYCVLGVNEVGGEDPSYQIDPQLIRLSDGEGLQIDPVEGTYSYSDDISSDSGTFGIEVADYCSIASINLNGSYLQVPSPVNNVYSISFSDLIVGNNSLIVITEDENSQALVYRFTLTYSEGPTPPTPTGPFIDKLYLYRGNPPATIYPESGVTTYNMKYGDYGTQTYAVEVTMPSNDYSITSYKLNDVAQTVPEKQQSALDDSYYYQVPFKSSGDTGETDGTIEIVVSDGTDTITYTIEVEYGLTPSTLPQFIIHSSNSSYDVYTEDGVYNYNTDISGTASDPFVITVSVDPQYIDNVSFYPFKVNGTNRTINIDYDTGVSTCTLTGADVPDISQGMTVEFTLWYDNVDYTFTIEYDYE